MRHSLVFALFLTIAGIAHSEDQPPESTSSDAEEIPLILIGRTEDQVSGDWARYIVPPVPGFPTGSPRSDIAVQKGHLTTAFKTAVDQIQPILNTISSVQGDYVVDQVEVFVTLNAEGRIAILLGSFGGEAGIKLVFRRPIQAP